MPTPFLRRTRPALLLTLCAGTAIGALATLAAPAYADVEPTAAMLRWPDVSQTHIVFSYANGLWIVPRSGGRAEPIANPPGQESFPRFSPDGKRIAFVGNYDGNRDLYTVPVSGGVPHRVTHHPGGEILCDWAPPAYGTGNELLFLTNGLAGLSRQTQIFAVDAKGGLPTQLPVPYAGFGALSPDGQWLAYTTHSTDSRTWKRYRGGMATDVWLFNINTKESRMATDWEGTDTLPMWVPGGDGAAFYYISDQGPEHRLNIWKYTLADGRREQITTYANDDVKWPSIGPGDNGQGEIVFQLGSELRLFNLGTRQDRVVKVTIPGDRPTVRTRIVDAARNISSASISPAGKRVAIEARGDIWSAPAKEGVTRNLSRTDGVFERGPAWSSDGRWIAYFSDQDGEYDLWIRPADVRTPAKPDAAKAPEKDEGEEVVDEHAWLRSPPRRLTDLGPGFRMGIVWSPDAKHVTYTDNGGRIYLTNIESGDTRTIDANPWGNPVGVSWSHNSAWITYAVSEDNPLSSNGVVYLYNVASGEKHALTSPMFSSGSPAFDRKGEFLYFTSNRIINAPMYSDIDSTFIYTGTQALYMVPLRSDVKNPFALRNDEEDFKKDDKKKEDKKKDEKKDEPTGDDAKNGDKKDDANGDKKDDAKADDGLSGTWSGTATSDTGQPPGGIPLTIKISLGAGGSISGTISSPMGEGQITGGSFNKATGALTINLSVGPIAATIEGTVSGEQFSGSWTSPQGRHLQRQPHRQGRRRERRGRQGKRRQARRCRQRLHHRDRRLRTPRDPVACSLGLFRQPQRHARRQTHLRPLRGARRQRRAFDPHLRPRRRGARRESRDRRRGVVRSLGRRQEDSGAPGRLILGDGRGRRRRQEQHRAHLGHAHPRRSAQRVAADLQRHLAPAARLFLRRHPPRRGLEQGARPLRPHARRVHHPRGRGLCAGRDDQRTQRRARLPEQPRRC